MAIQTAKNGSRGISPDLFKGGGTKVEAYFLAESYHSGTSAPQSSAIALWSRRLPA